MTIPHPAGRLVVGGLVNDPLWLPGKQTRFQVYTILGGQTLLPGTVLGQITASGKLKMCVAAAGDGSQVPVGILGEPMATFAADGTTSQDQTMAIAVEGYVNESRLIYGAGYTLALLKTQLRNIGILTRVPGYSG